MGFFATYQFDGSTWAEGDPEAGPTGPEPWLWVDVHDSDFATIRYAPAGPGTGVAFLNSTPRAYFGSEDASPQTDVEREALGLAQWWSGHSPGGSVVGQESKRYEIAALLASDDDEMADGEETDDADIFAEIKAARLLKTLGLPMPEGIVDGDA